MSPVPTPPTFNQKASVEAATLCCKQIKATISTNTVNEALAVSKLLSLSVGSFPNEAMTITPQLEVRNAATGIYSVYVPTAQASMFSPASFTVQPSAFKTVFSGDAVLQLQTSTFAFPEGVGGEGTYRITLVLSRTASPGVAWQEFDLVYGSSSSATSFPFFVLPSNAALPAPTFQKVEFSDDATKLYIAFDSDTNRGSTATSFSCSELFTFDCAATSTCYWESATRVRVTLVGTIECAVPGDLLTLNAAAKIKAACKRTSCPSYADWDLMSVLGSNATITVPETAVSPSVQLSAPTTIGSCDDLLIDSTNSQGMGGRDWSSWFVDVDSNVPHADNITELLAFVNRSLDTYTLSPPTAIPARLMLAGYKYVFTFRFTNFLGKVGVGEKSVLKLDNVIPSATITGASTISIISKNVLNLGSSSFIASCDGTKSTNGLSISWAVYKNGALDLSLLSSSKNPFGFRLPAFSLQPSNTYEVKLTATQQRSLASSSMTVTVLVGTGSLYAIIVGGAEQAARAEELASLDASASFDEDKQGVTGLDAGLSYDWTCQQSNPLNEGCPYLVIDSQSYTNSKRDTFGAKLFYKFTIDGQNTVSVITVEVTDPLTSRTATTSVSVSVLSGGAPVATMSSNAVLGVLNPGKGLQIFSEISTPVVQGALTVALSCSWSTDDPSFDLSANALGAVTDINRFGVGNSVTACPN